MKSLIEFLSLTFILYPKVLWFQHREERFVRKKLYPMAGFKQLDRRFKRVYRLCNPFKVHKTHVKRFGKGPLHSYGETPLSVFYEIFERVSLRSSDVFVDLGCGRGRGVLYASECYQCLSYGVERISQFCLKTNRVAKDLPSKLLCQDISEFDFSIGNIFYFYSLCMNEEEILSFMPFFSHMKRGSKLVTVSFSLESFSQEFQVVGSWTSMFPWGEGEVFVHVKNM